MRALRVDVALKVDADDANGALTPKALPINPIDEKDPSGESISIDLNMGVGYMFAIVYCFCVLFLLKDFLAEENRLFGRLVLSFLSFRLGLVF